MMETGAAALEKLRDRARRPGRAQQLQRHAARGHDPRDRRVTLERLLRNRGEAEQPEQLEHALTLADRYPHVQQIEHACVIRHEALLSLLWP